MLNSGFKNDFISSRLFNERWYDFFPTIAVVSATIFAIVCISNFSFCTSVKIFRAPATTLTNDFFSVANFASPFLWLEDIILQSSVLTNGINKGQLLGSKIFFLYFLWSGLKDSRSKITANNVSHFFMKRGDHFTLIVNFLNLIKIQALHTLWLSSKFWTIAICLWGILIKNLLTWPDLFSFFESLLSPCRFVPVLDVALNGDWSSLTGKRDNSLTGDLRCSLTEDMFSLTGDVGPFTGNVNVLCFLWDWWELY